MTWNETNPTALDIYERAFCIIANASGGDWSKESTEWQEAATAFREAYHDALSTGRASSEETDRNV